jgi:PEP-CTERM motif
MKKILACFAVLAAVSLSSSVASAAQACVVGQDVLDSGFSCSIGGLTFSMFSSNSLNPIGIEIGGVGSNPAALSFSPNIPYTQPGQPPITQNDIYLQFVVTGGISGVGLTLTGVPGAGVNEGVCAVQQSLAVGTLGNCSAGNVLAATFSVLAGGSGSASFANAPVAWIFKDINDGGGILSEVNQVYTSGVPEPMTLSMMGAGLLGLSLISRRRKKS